MDYNKLNYDDFYIWQDKDIRFDVPKTQLALRIGEKIIDNLENIEDTKGCNGDIGTMLLTNLRMIWYCNTNVKINLTIGFDCMVNNEIRQTSSKVMGEITALYLKCRFNNNRFEFVFNSLTKTDRIFVSFNSIYKAYDSSRLYREMKLKGFLTQDKNLITLPDEQIINKVSGVSNCQSDQAIVGTYYLTNIRLVWYSNNIDNYNLSLPWIQIKGIKPKDLPKYGKTVTIETNKQIGGNLICFKFSSNENIENIIKELNSNHLKFLENPILGVDMRMNLLNNESLEKEKKNNLNNLNKLSVITEINESKLDYSVIDSNNKLNESNFNSTGSNNKSLNNKTSIIGHNDQDKKNDKFVVSDTKSDEFNKMLLNNFNDEVEIIQTNYFNEQPTMVHYMTSNQDKRNTINDITYCPELGMSIERLPDGVNIENLWKIILN